MREIYRLTLSHYIVDDEFTERHKIDDPVVVEEVFDKRYINTPIILNRMLDEMKDYVLLKMGEVTE